MEKFIKKDHLKIIFKFRYSIQNKKFIKNFKEKSYFIYYEHHLYVIIYLCDCFLGINYQSEINYYILVEYTYQYLMLVTQGFHKENRFFLN